MKALILALVALLLQGCVGYVPVRMHSYPTYAQPRPFVIDCYCVPGPNGRLMPIRPYYPSY